MEMEKNDFNANELDEGPVTSVVDLARALEKVKLEVVWTTFRSPRFRGFSAGILKNQSVPDSKWSVLLERPFMQDAASGVFQR